MEALLSLLGFVAVATVTPGPNNLMVLTSGANFGLARTLPLALWRRLLDNGRIEEAALRDAAIGHLGGIYRAAAPIAPGVTMLDALMACLLVIGRGDRPERRAGLGPDAAFIAKWCGAFFDHGLTAMPLPNRDLGLYRAVLAMAAYDPDYRTLTGARGAALLLSVPRDPLEAISEGLASLEAEVDPLAYLSGLVARLPGWAGHIRWRSEHADADRVADAPATMADLVALWILLARADALSAPLGAPSADKDQSAALLAHFGLTAKALGPRDAQRLDSVAEVDDDRLGALFMMAAERSYAYGLMPALQRAARTSNPPARPDAQLVFCIDVRSEVFRRALVEGHALDRLRDLVDAQEALLLTTRQESLDLFQLDHLTHRHIFTSGWTPSEHVGDPTQPTAGRPERTSVRYATASFVEVKGPARISEQTSARRAQTFSSNTKKFGERISPCFLGPLEPSCPY